jgi:hypothetical protein
MAGSRKKASSKARQDDFPGEATLTGSIKCTSPDGSMTAWTVLISPNLVVPAPFRQGSKGGEGMVVEAVCKNKGSRYTYMKWEIVLHCYMPESQRLTVLHILLHAVTFCRLLVVNDLRCYINDNGEEVIAGCGEASSKSVNKSTSTSWSSRTKNAVDPVLLSLFTCSRNSHDLPLPGSPRMTTRFSASSLF